eukprot:81149-Chlamydomonas_euryale.AAC.2
MVANSGQCRVRFLLKPDLHPHAQNTLQLHPGKHSSTHSLLTNTLPHPTITTNAHPHPLLQLASYRRRGYVWRRATTPPPRS